MMAVQMYLVHPRGEAEDREALAEFIALREGFILMATSAGSLIAAFDDAHFEAVRAHRCTDFAGGVNFNPQGKAAQKLQQLFAHNVAQQLVERQSNSQAADRADAFPPGYRPPRWASREETEAGGNAW